MRTLRGRFCGRRCLLFLCRSERNGAVVRPDCVCGSGFGGHRCRIGCLPGRGERFLDRAFFGCVGDVGLAGVGQRGLGLFRSAGRGLRRYGRGLSRWMPVFCSCRDRFLHIGHHHLGNADACPLVTVLLGRRCRERRRAEHLGDADTCLFVFARGFEQLCAFGWAEFVLKGIGLCCG